MTTPSFPLLLAYEIFYTESGRIYHLPGERKRILLTEAEYTARIQKYRDTKTEYMLLYDYMFVLKKDKWEAIPSEINIDEVEFYYQLSIINEQDYMKLKYLYSEYGNKKN
ncbi:hypothetical protein EHV15_35235 [Paenibacillus oralis]|uniref:Uncharacterized protein n=1 Tax=Paenibacillus oralis TaxID=2490856 RepID=A0A3P3TBD1_9BACL|nr:hypothetical protein [Paenibacillus oralis]RRJ54829.1 hypothetical protein EHV15_35235 [Paenibacillus oralis]